MRSAPFLSLVSMMVIAIAAGWPVNVGNVSYYGTLTLFAVIGNFFGNLEPNYLVGIRTPWTLEDPGTWRATHRLIGRWMVFGSVALLAVGIFAVTFRANGPARGVSAHHGDLEPGIFLLVAYLFAWYGHGDSGVLVRLGHSAWFFHRRPVWKAVLVSWGV